MMGILQSLRLAFHNIAYESANPSFKYLLIHHTLLVEKRIIPPLSLRAALAQ